MRKIIKTLQGKLLISSLLLLHGCSDSNNDLTRYIHKIKSKPTRPIDPIPEFAPLPKFLYPENDNRRSPFVAYTSGNGEDQNAPDKNRPKEKLEEFPLDSLKFVGTLQEGNVVWALIQAPDKQIYRVRAGNHMGQHYGVIVSINNNEVDLQETVMVEGKWKKQKVTLHMNSKA